VTTSRHIRNIKAQSACILCIEMDSWALKQEEIHDDLCQVMDIFLNGIKFETVDNKWALHFFLLIEFGEIQSAE
jgi:hypothetical protein